MKTVRELSVAGPCITLGLVLRETDRRISYRDRHGTPKFISRRWAIHTEPCPSCPDHPNTKYPDALEDVPLIGWNMDREHVKGAADKVKGTIEDTAGKVTDDKKLQSKGYFDKAKGSGHKLAGDVRRAKPRLARPE